MSRTKLVSCVVVSYNSSNTIIETLNSIKDQTYKQIELIISDDCSTDDTVLICRKWLEMYSKRFVRVELITVDKNTGITANFNRAIIACRGEWVKECAADDILLDNCIEDYMIFIKDNPEVRWAASLIRKYMEIIDEKCCVERKYVASRSFYNLSSECQLKHIAMVNRIPAASLFYQRSLFEELGGYDETYSFEDYPFHVKALEHGYKCFFMDIETVGYRIHNSTSNGGEQLFHMSFLNECRRFQKERCFKYLSNWQKYGQLAIWKIQDIIVMMHLNKNNFIMSHTYNFVFLLICKLFNLSY